jgi:hypothetical protein
VAPAKGGGKVCGGLSLVIAILVIVVLVVLQARVRTPALGAKSSQLGAEKRLLILRSSSVIR